MYKPCNNCKGSSHPDIEIPSNSIKNKIYNLCLKCATNLVKSPYPIIGDFIVSTKTVESFSIKIKNIIREAYNTSTLYNIPIAKCLNCHKNTYSTFYDPNNLIQDALNINKQEKFICYECIQKIY